MSKIEFKTCSSCRCSVPADFFTEGETRCHLCDLNICECGWTYENGETCKNKIHEMKKLEIEFEGKGEVQGTHFRQLLSSENAFMYELTDTETGQKRYEVFERREQQEGEAVIGGQTVKYEAKELYPKSNQFGIWAWCFTDHEKALKRYHSINTILKTA